MTSTEEFARLGQAIGDAINRLPPDYRISIHLERKHQFVVLKSPDGWEVQESINAPLVDGIGGMLDIAVEDTKRRGEG